jgi:hypothetical protein
MIAMFKNTLASLTGKQLYQVEGDMQSHCTSSWHLISSDKLDFQNI